MNEKGLTLIELLIAMAISAILAVAVFTTFSDFYQSGEETSALDKRIANAANITTIATHFLTQANFVGQTTSAALVPPQVQNTAYTNNVGLAIQWQPVLPQSVTGPLICEGVLADQTLYGSNVQVHGMQWTASQVLGPTTSSNPCDTGTTFFPANNSWAFTLVQRQGCPNPSVNPNAVILTNNYNGSYANVQVITVCLPNLQ